MTRWCRPTLLGVLLAAWPAAAGAHVTDSLAADEALAGAEAALAEHAPGRAFELARLARAFDPDRSLAAWELMGRAASEMGDQALAHRCFRRALGLADPRARHRLLARMQLARDELGLVRVDVQPGGAELLVDGQPAEYEIGEGALLLRPGSHRLEARLEGHEARYAVVAVTAGGEHAVRMVLPEGAPDILLPVPGPSYRRSGQRWLTGNAVLIGIGGLGLAAAGSADAGVPGLGESMGLQLGLSFGLVLGASLNLAASAAFDPHGDGWLFLPRILVVPLLAGVALGLGTALWFDDACQDEGEACAVDPETTRDVAGATGTVIGIAIATLANVGLGGRDTPIAIGLGMAFAGLGVVELAFAIEAASAAGALRAQGDALGGAEGAALHEQAAARDGLGQVAAGLAIGLGALAISTFELGLAGEPDSLDLTVAAGPGTLSISGAF